VIIIEKKKIVLDQDIYYINYFNLIHVAIPINTLAALYIYEQALFIKTSVTCVTLTMCG